VARFDDDALVLDSLPYQDRHMLVTLLTRKTGATRGVLQNARGGKAPRAAAAQVLSLVHVTGYIGPRAELATFRELDLVTSSFPLAADIERATAAAVVAELLNCFCPQDEPAPRRYRLGVALLEGLLQGMAPEVAVAYAQFWLLSLGGLFPDPETEELEAEDIRYLITLRHSSVPQLPPDIRPRAASWLERLTRQEAERRLPALDFFRNILE
jgi:DNA repair protein RecO (recombination protein O)